MIITCFNSKLKKTKTLEMSCLHAAKLKLELRKYLFLLFVLGRMVGPCIQCLLIGTRWLQRLWSIVMDVIVRPFLLSAGRCCGGFSIHLANEWDAHVQVAHPGLSPGGHSFLSLSYANLNKCSFFHTASVQQYLLVLYKDLCFSHICEVKVVWFKAMSSSLVKIYFAS